MSLYDNEMNKPKNVLLLISGFLMFLAIIGGWPYGFYTFLRIVIFAISIYMVISLIQSDLIGFAWGYGFIGFLFNPLIPFHLGRDIWVIVNWITLGFFVYSILKIDLYETKELIKK
jgi:hypothetical protein